MVLDLTPEQLGYAATWLASMAGLAGAQRQALKNLRADLTDQKAETKDLRARLDRLIEQRGFAGAPQFWAPV